MNDSLGASLFVRYRDTIFVFGICGLVGVLVDLDHIWKICGMAEPFSLTWFVGRALHTTLVFILYGVIAGSIAYAYANRQGQFRRSMGLPKRRISGSISSVCWDNYTYDCNSCVYKYCCSKEVEIKWP
jgi:hypothetical protein